MRAVFHQSVEDAETRQFLSGCREKSDWLFTQMFYSIAEVVLSWFMHRTSINGLLDREITFVFTQEQFDLFAPELRQPRGNVMDMNKMTSDHCDDITDSDSVKLCDKMLEVRRMIDLGAGHGTITTKMTAYFDMIYATEASPAMRERLAGLGFNVLNVTTWSKYDGTQRQHTID